MLSLGLSLDFRPDVLLYSTGQKPGITLSRPDSLSPGTSSKSFENQALEPKTQGCPRLPPGPQSDDKFMKNRAWGPLDLISDVLLSIFDFERQYNDFHGFSSSGGSLEDNKSTEIDSDNHIETMYRKNTAQSTICIEK